MRRLGPVIATPPTGDWPEVENAVLNAWEDEARTSGSRVAAFDDAAGTVLVRAER